jgi:hypothetical protein
LVGLLAWTTTPRLLRGNIVVDRANVDISIRHIPGHHGYLKNPEIFSRHDISIDLASSPSVSIAE